MRTLFILFLGFFAIETHCQDKVVFNPTKDSKEKLFEYVYRYPQFLLGTAIDKNQSTIQAKFNYNHVSNNIEFIDPKGDTLSLQFGNNFDRICVGVDTFFYYNKAFIRQLTHYPAGNILVMHCMKYNGSEKKSAYDGYSSTSANNSIHTIDVGYGIQNLNADENLIYTFKDNYYFSAKYNQFYPATRKGVLDMLQKYQKQVKEFLGKNEINFNKLDDLEKLLRFTQTLIK